MNKLWLGLLLLISTACFAVSDQFGMVTQSNITVTASSAKALSANAYRSYLLVQNVGTNTIILKIGSVHSGTEGVQIPAGGYYEPSKAPNGSIWLVSASGSQAVVILEGISQ